MKTLLLTLSICVSLFSSDAIAQGWVVYPNSPYSPYRHEDISFCSPDSGLIISMSGKVYLTGDGGVTWDTIFSDSSFFGRSVGMMTPNTFIVGQYGSAGPFNPVDSNVVYVTFNKGQTWNPVTNFNGPKPVGICGISVVNDTVAMGVGRIQGNPIFIKTTDGGNTFQSMNMSAHSAGLVDCHFFSPDTGFAVGRSPNTSLVNSVPTVIYTTDGGITWQNVYSGTVTSRWCWKISFPSRLVGYVSVENNGQLGMLDTNYVLKTTDGGLSWTILPVDLGNARLQGIGFVNDSLGWTGDAGVRKTTDGGITWSITSDIDYFNRMRKVNDSVFVAVGELFNKYDFYTSDFIEVPEKEAIVEDLKGNPNPFHTGIKVSYKLKKAHSVSVQLYNQPGIVIQKFSIPAMSPGDKSFDLDLENLVPGAYYLVLSAESRSYSLTLIKTDK